MASRKGSLVNGLEPRKLFIVHAAEDMGLIGPRIIDVLEKEYNIPCLIAERDFQGGKGTITNIIDAIKTSFKTVVVLTDRSIKSHWVKYETLLALEKSQRLKVLSLAVLLFDINVEPKDLQFGVLTNAMTIHVDLNRENWKSIMVEKIQRQVSLSKALVITNLATGQAWSHFTGYCNVVFPHLRENITNSQWYKDNAGRFPVMEFNLIPYSAKTCGKLQNMDSRIRYVGDLETIIAPRGSFHTRPYNVSVYSMTDPDLDKDIFFVCQIPHTLSLLNKAEEGCKDLKDRTDDNDSDVPNLQISSGERSLQAARFYFTLNRILNHPKNKACSGLARLLLFDDSKEDLVDVLLKALREEMSKTAPKTDQQALKLIALQEKSQQSSADTSNQQRNRTVFIACDENPSDLAFKQELTIFLKKNNFLVWDKDSAGKSYASILEVATKESRWTIFLLSKEATKSANFPLLSFNCRNVLHDSVDRNEMSVIPVLDGINEDELLYELMWVTYLERKDEHFQDRLIETLNLKSTHMESTVSATDVHQGLAWAYVMNYLSLVLDDHMKQMDTVERTEGLVVYKKLFIVVPKSCFLKSLDKNEHGELLDPRFQSENEAKFIKKEVAGVVNRWYQLHLFRLRAPAKEYILPVEFPNSVLCLHEMASLDKLSGLSRDKLQLHDEARAFCELSKQILSVSRFKDKARLIYYDDEKEGVADALLNALKDEENVPV